MSEEKLHRAERESDFERRWAEAGATSDEIASVGASFKTAQPDQMRRLDRAWREIERKARKKQYGLRWQTALVAAMAGATMAGTAVLLIRSQSEVEPKEERLARVDPSFTGGRLELSADALMQRDESGDLVLRTGTAHVEVDPRPRGAAPLRFRAADISVEVVGTIFALTVEDGLGAVRVYEGAVIVRHPGTEPVRVDASTGIAPVARKWSGATLKSADRWGFAAAKRRAQKKAEEARLESRAPRASVDVARAEAASEPEPVPAAPDTPAPSEQARADIEPARTSVPSTVEPSSADSASSERDITERRHDRHRRVHRALAELPRKEPELEPPPSIAAPIAAPAVETPPIPAPDPVSPVEPPAPRARSAEELRAAAAAARVQSVPRPAPHIVSIDSLERLERSRNLPESTRKEIAAYRQGLVLVKDGRPAEAAEKFQRCLDQFPQGVLHLEAQIYRLESLYRARQFDLFKREAEAWLTGYAKDDDFARQVRALLSTMP
jgi:TolA-binding protein